MIFLMMLSVILWSMLMIILSILSVICGNNCNWLLNLNLTCETLWTGAKSSLLISMLEKLNWFHLTNLMTLVLLVWKCMGLFLRKNHIYHMAMHGILLLSLGWCPSCYLELFDKLQKLICRIAGPSLAASLGSLDHRKNVTSLIHLCRYYFGRFSSDELAQLVPLPYSWGRSTCYSDRLYYFSLTIPRCYKDVYVNSFFLWTASLWISLPIECFPLTYDLNSFKSRINKHLLTVHSF